MLKPKIIVSIFILLLALFLIGCSNANYTATNCIENDTENSISMSYSSFNGKKVRLLNLKNEDKLVLNVSVTTIKGKLEVTLYDENNKQLFSVENPKNQIIKTIDITKNSNYKIQVEEMHVGSFNISWDIKS